VSVRALLERDTLLQRRNNSDANTGEAVATFGRSPTVTLASFWAPFGANRRGPYFSFWQKNPRVIARPAKLAEAISVV